MANTPANSDNQYAGGINFSSSIGGAGGGTVQFDLPLATVAAMQNRSMDFLTANSSQNKAFLTQSMGRNDAAVKSTSDLSFDYLNRGLSTIRTGNLETGSAIQNVNTTGGIFSFLRAQVAPKAKGGGCFITTAICDAEGKADDCDELTTLRKFRDDVMLKDSRLAPLVKEYYEIAPKIVHAINQRKHYKDVYLMLRMQYLENALTAIRCGDIDVAVGEYVQMVAVARQIAGV